MKLLPVALLLSAAALAAAVPVCPAVIRQPVQQYFLSFDAAEVYQDSSIRGFNPYRNYTHLGTDFGVLQLSPIAGEIMAAASGAEVITPAGAGTGIWHSLDGLQSELARTLNFSAVWPATVRPEFQASVTGVSMTAEGRGRIHLEIKNPEGEIVWTQAQEIAGETPALHTWPVNPAVIPRAKTLVWFAGENSRISVASVTLDLTLPPALSFDDYLLLASWAKLSRCRDDASGFVRDRAHAPAGAFDCVPATGMFALAACAAEDAGLLVPGSARRMLSETLAAIRSLRRAHGLLPHFVRLQNGKRDLAPTTEWSTIDTALTYHSLYLAAICLDDPATADTVLAMIEEIDWVACAGPDGAIRHGFRGSDGELPIEAWWTDWGGETALLLLLQSMALGPEAHAPIQRSGHVFRGNGFIAEIQSLFYPWFSRPEPDAVSGVSWLQSRRDLLATQLAYFPSQTPPPAAAAAGIFGLSSGEARNGRGYTANGTDLPGLSIIHPHYMLMSALTDPDRDRATAGLDTLVQQGFLPPWGLAENIDDDLKSWLPMLGALNASFEILSAAHYRAAVRGLPDPIYEAANRSPVTRAAARRFYPALPE